MKNKILINPIGLKGNELHERQLALMGIKPINENENKNNYAVELTKIGPDGNAYAIVRENHEYFIKKTNKTTGLVLEDFKYIGGLQNKKDEAYPSYAKAIKQLNLKFKSLAEAYNKGSEINVFEDDNLLEHHPLKADMALSAKKGIGDNQEYVVDKAGTPLSNKAKEGKEEGQFGDNVADKKVADEFEKVNEGFSFGFKQEGMFGDDLEMTEEEKAIQEMMDRYNEEKEMSDRNKELAAMTPPYDEITYGDKLKAIGVFEGDDELEESNLDYLKSNADYHKRVNDLYPSDQTTSLSDKHNTNLELALKDKVDELQNMIKFYEDIANVSGSENFAAIETIKTSINDLKNQILSLNQKYGSSSEPSLKESIGELEKQITMPSNKGEEYYSMTDDELRRLRDFYRDLFDKSNGNKNDDTEEQLTALKDLKSQNRSSVKPNVGPYGHSLEESIERLNSLLDGELKKKALK